MKWFKENQRNLKIYPYQKSSDCIAQEVRLGSPSELPPPPPKKSKDLNIQFLQEEVSSDWLSRSETACSDSVAALEQA